MRRRAEYRNEVKTRLDDITYRRMQEFKRQQYIESDSAALARLCQMLLCGIVRDPSEDVSDGVGRNGTAIHAHE